MTRKELSFAVIAIGISSLLTQLLFLREMVNIFYGNELVIGIFLANWLLLTGLGSFFGKYFHKVKRKHQVFLLSQIILSFLPLTLLLLTRYIRGYIFLPGAMVDISLTLIFSFLLLLPYSIVSGYLFTLACFLFRKRSEIGKVYWLDSIGDLTGGFLFSFILIYFFNLFQISFINIVINILAVLFLSRALNQKGILIFSFSLLILFSSIFLSIDLNQLTLKFLYKNQELLYQKDSPYGNLVITKTLNQLNFFENGLPLFSTQDVITREETIHYAMVQHSNPKKVLLLSGGISGTLDEILKYNPQKIDYVELDPEIIRVGLKFGWIPKDKRINVILTDARFWVKKIKEKYDIVIVDLPDPSTTQLNRFYTMEFFREVKRILNPNGVVSLSLSSQENYLSPEARKLNSAIYRTLGKVFKNVIVIPGEENYFIASDGNLSYKIGELIEEKNISTRYVNKYYLSGKLTQERINYFLECMEEKVKLNRDFDPITYYYYLLYWLSYFKFNFSIFIFFILFLSILSILLTKGRSIPLAIFTTGFAGGGMEIILLLAFQIIYGYVYTQIGIMITLFMLGITLGCFYIHRNLKRIKLNGLIKIEILIFVYCILIPLIFIQSHKIENKVLLFIIANFMFPTSIFLLGLLIGAEFPIASKFYKGKMGETASVLYFSDLIGGCIGSLSLISILLPFLGLINSSFLIAILNLITGILVKMKH